MKAEVIPAASLYAALMIEAGFCGEYAARSRPSNSLIEREIKKREEKREEREERERERGKREKRERERERRERERERTHQKKTNTTKQITITKQTKKERKNKKKTKTHRSFTFIFFRIVVKNGNGFKSFPNVFPINIKLFLVSSFISCFNLSKHSSFVPTIGFILIFVPRSSNRLYLLQRKKTREEKEEKKKREREEEKGEKKIL